MKVPALASACAKRSLAVRLRLPVRPARHVQESSSDSTKTDNLKKEDKKKRKKARKKNKKENKEKQKQAKNIKMQTKSKQ